MHGKKKQRGNEEKRKGVSWGDEFGEVGDEKSKDRVGMRVGL